MDGQQWSKKQIWVDSKVYHVLYKTCDNKHFIKPIDEYTSHCSHCGGHVKGYHSFEYESMFGFGSHCEGFDSNKVVDITMRSS